MNLSKVWNNMETTAYLFRTEEIIFGIACTFHGACSFTLKLERESFRYINIICFSSGIVINFSCVGTYHSYSFTLARIDWQIAFVHKSTNGLKCEFSISSAGCYTKVLIDHSAVSFSSRMVNICIHNVPEGISVMQETICFLLHLNAGSCVYFLRR